MDTYVAILMNNYFLISFVQNKFICDDFHGFHEKWLLMVFWIITASVNTCSKFTSDISNVYCVHPQGFSHHIHNL